MKIWNSQCLTTLREAWDGLLWLGVSRCTWLPFRTCSQNDYRLQIPRDLHTSQSHFHLRKCPPPQKKTTCKIGFSIQELHLSGIQTSFWSLSHCIFQFNTQLAHLLMMLMHSPIPQLRWAEGSERPKRRVFRTNLVGFFGKISAANWNVDTRNKNHTSKDMVPKMSHRDSLLR